MLTDEELLKAITKAFQYKKSNMTASSLRIHIKRITGKNVTLKRMMQIVNDNGCFCVEIV